MWVIKGLLMAASKHPALHRAIAAIVALARGGAPNVVRSPAGSPFAGSLPAGSLPAVAPQLATTAALALRVVLTDDALLHRSKGAAVTVLERRSAMLLVESIASQHMLTVQLMLQRHRSLNRLELQYVAVDNHGRGGHIGPSVPAFWVGSAASGSVSPK